MLMALDMFAFEIGSLPFTELQQRCDWRHAQADRFGVRPAFQFLGPGAETIELAGALYPGQGIGAYSSIDTIKAMAATGDAYQLVNGTGDVLGDFIIRGLDVTSSLFFVDGAARRADFRLSLERVDNTPTIMPDTKEDEAIAEKLDEAAEKIGDLDELAAAAQKKMQQINGIVDQLSQNISNISDALSPLGIALPQVAAEIRNMSFSLLRGVAASDRQIGALLSIGLDASGIASAVTANARGALQDVLTRVGTLAAGARSSVITDLFSNTESTTINNTIIDYLIANVGLLSLDE